MKNLQKLKKHPIFVVMEEYVKQWLAAEAWEKSALPMPLRAVYEEYRQWCIDTGTPCVGKNVLSRILVTLGFLRIYGFEGTLIYIGRQ